MFWSKAFIPTLKEAPKEAETVSHKLMLRAGLVRMLMAGVYSYLPLGLKVLNNIKRVIRQEMDSCGAAEVLLPALQPIELWQKTGRDKDIGEVMIRFTDRRGRVLSLGPTHEEVITDLVKNHVSSYRQLPLVLYQIQTKFRDEIRPRFGLVRACEFVMKDAYSFDKDEAGLEKNYQAMYAAYQRILKRCGLEFLITEADPGIMGGNVSHEFMVPAGDGEDLVLACPKCKTARAFKETEDTSCTKCAVSLEKINTIEVGHIFKLGTKYSSVFGANFLDEHGKLRPIMMGCYGIGVSRLISAIIEQNHDADGIIWPNEVAPFNAAILALEANDSKVLESAIRLYKEFEEKSIPVLLDDRDERAGVKFKDADLIGLPVSIIVSPKSLEQEKFEIKVRSERNTFLVERQEVVEKVLGILKKVTRKG